MAKKKSTIRKVVETVEGWVGMNPSKNKPAKKKPAKKESGQKLPAKKARRKTR